MDLRLENVGLRVPWKAFVPYAWQAAAAFNVALRVECMFCPLWPQDREAPDDRLHSQCALEQSMHLPDQCICNKACSVSGPPFRHPVEQLHGQQAPYTQPSSWFCLPMPNGAGCYRPVPISKPMILTWQELCEAPDRRICPHS
jgi:hypothetical protein